MTLPDTLSSASSGAEAVDPAFPWGSNNPTRVQRIVVALVIATLAAGLIEAQYLFHPGYRSDFGLAWFGASSLIHHIDPYPLVGPGNVYEWRWPLLYPGTALVAALPFALMSEQMAAITFVWLSSFLLAWSMTRRSWHLLPLFTSYSFASSAWLAQWSLIFTAAVFIPWLGFLVVAKPQSGIPVLAQSTSRLTLKAAAIGGVLLLAISLALLPSWPSEWLALIGRADNVRPPITRLGGVFVLLVLLRWRRPEAWLVLSMALMPATWAWYNVLILLTIPATYREACILSLISSIGAIFGGYLMPPVRTMDEFDRFAGAVLIATAYLPAVLAVLRRPNEGPMPAWFDFVARRLEGRLKRERKVSAT